MLALIKGLFSSDGDGSAMLPPDNRCCFCLTLRKGSIIISLANICFYTGFFLWYLTSNSFGDSITGGLTYLDVFVILTSLGQFAVNILLLVGSVRRIPNLTLPWIIANAVLCLLCMVGIVMTLFWGTTTFELTHNEYITFLVILGLIMGINLFCIIVVFQFRHNILLEQRLVRDSVLLSQNPGSAPLLTTPLDEEISRQDSKPPIEEGPPAYEDAMAMMESHPK